MSQFSNTQYGRSNTSYMYTGAVPGQVRTSGNRTNTSGRTAARTNTGNRNGSTGRNGYIHDNVVRKAVPANPALRPVRELSTVTRKNRDKAHYMNLGYVLFLTVAVAITAATLLSYVRLQSELTLTVKQVSSLERELNSMRLDNDEALNRIESGINLEEIKRIAVDELGMTYAKEGQVVIINDEGNDYVRQLKEIP
ncbi:MAG: cell division protein FtsL [Lachnospiraceae bacterium]|nr:cell division protein FtsL [Lachnospiraceae bacterium]